MEIVKLAVHRHPLLPITRFSFDHICKGCGFNPYIYGGYRCNELGCEYVFHEECAKPFPEIIHSSHHPDHPLKLFQSSVQKTRCSECRSPFESGYTCSICDFKLDLFCAKRPALLLILENPNLHQHPLALFSSIRDRDCKTCDSPVLGKALCYGCHMCKFVVHEKCAKKFPLANHTSHQQHPLKRLTLDKAPNANEKCLLCGIKFEHFNYKLHRCDVCNFSICPGCMKHPPPVRVESPTTHAHELHLVPRRIEFTCNACGTLGDLSPYFCLQCNFMIHRQCIDLPRIININRHDHRISYTPRLGHHGEERKCKVCRKKVDGFYGAYTCTKCPSFVVHSLCATRKDVWDMIELEGMPEEDENAPFEVIDDNTIKHFSHAHNLRQINKDGYDWVIPENIVCEACLLQILWEPFYSCEQCNFILHEKCANHPRMKRHGHSNQPFTLVTNSRHKVDRCGLCDQIFTGFRYKNIRGTTIDVRCATMSDTLVHGSHPHPLYFDSTTYKSCSGCGRRSRYVYSCDECDYTLGGECFHFPEMVVKNRYDDHPLFLSFGDMDVDGHYWCEVCETKVTPKEWFYTCDDCGTILHKSCVVGDLTYIMPGSHLKSLNDIVLSNTSICRPICQSCNSHCKLPSVIKVYLPGGYVLLCSTACCTFVPLV